MQIEREATDRHEYRDGKMVGMAGGSANHSKIMLNFLGWLNVQLEGKPCRAYVSDLRVRIPRKVLYIYPDGLVVCGPLQFDPADPQGQTITNPKVIVEVLSPTTEGYDRGEKFERYSGIETLEEYVLVSQETPKVETFLRSPNATWVFTLVRGLESAVTVQSIGVELPLARIYSGVDLPPQETESQPNAQKVSVNKT